MSETLHIKVRLILTSRKIERPSPKEAKTLPVRSLQLRLSHRMTEIFGREGFFSGVRIR
jgi:hypothetical protein